MTQRITSSGRSRPNVVSARFSDSEQAILEAERARTGKGAGTLLREAFLAPGPAEAAAVPPFADGAVAELRHGPDGTVIAEVRIPGPGDGADEPRPLTFADVERLSPAQCEALSAVLRDRINARLADGSESER